ncbi:MAG: tyrosine-type recombinase/integrase [Proteobacteria bacterium]|nr:tyrosine-type recombinase/integrase [Pseudomonadota bacterium]
MALSDLLLKKMTPKKTKFEVSDGNGLSIQVLPAGTKSWIFRYMIDGRARRMTLGRYPTISLADVRQLHGAAMQEVERGIDPGVKKQEAKATRKAEPNIIDLLDEFWDRELQHKASGKDQKRMVTKDVLPLWGDRKVKSITRRDTVLLLDNVRDRAKITANRLQTVLVRMFNFAAERGMLDYSPLTGMKKQREKARDRVLSNEEIKIFWDALDLDNLTMDIYRVSKLALKMILLTGQRPGEVCGMTWDEIDGNTWTIPATRMKSKDAHSVPLSDMALEIIEQARIYSGDSLFVFASTQKDEGATTTRALSRAVSRHWLEIGLKEKFTPHDLRRTLRTRLAEIGIDNVVAERVLAHKLQGLLAVYNRYDYDTEKRQALDKWAKKLRQIVGIEEPETGNIIELRRKMA